MQRSRDLVDPTPIVNPPATQELFAFADPENDIDHDERFGFTVKSGVSTSNSPCPLHGNIVSACPRCKEDQKQSDATWWTEVYCNDNVERRVIRVLGRRRVKLDLIEIGTGDHHTYVVLPSSSRDPLGVRSHCVVPHLSPRGLWLLRERFLIVHIFAELCCDVGRHDLYRFPTRIVISGVEAAAYETLTHPGIQHHVVKGTGAWHYDTIIDGVRVKGWVRHPCYHYNKKGLCYLSPNGTQGDPTVGADREPQRDCTFECQRPRTGVLYINPGIHVRCHNCEHGNFAYVCPHCREGQEAEEAAMVSDAVHSTSDRYARDHYAVIRFVGRDGIEYDLSSNYPHAVGRTTLFDIAPSATAGFLPLDPAHTIRLLTADEVKAYRGRSLPLHVAATIFCDGARMPLGERIPTSFLFDRLDLERYTALKSIHVLRRPEVEKAFTYCMMFGGTYGCDGTISAWIFHPDATPGNAAFVLAPNTPLIDDEPLPSVEDEGDEPLSPVEEDDGVTPKSTWPSAWSAPEEHGMGPSTPTVPMEDESPSPSGTGSPDPTSPMEVDGPSHSVLRTARSTYTIENPGNPWRVEVKDGAFKFCRDPADPHEPGQLREMLDIANATEAARVRGENVFTEHIRSGGETVSAEHNGEPEVPPWARSGCGPPARLVPSEFAQHLISDLSLFEGVECKLCVAKATEALDRHLDQSCADPAKQDFLDAIEGVEKIKCAHCIAEEGVARMDLDATEGGSDVA